MLKKLQISVCACFLLVLSSLTLVSCEKSNADLIDDYRKLAKEVVESSQKGDLVKLAKLADKGLKLEEELNKRDLTEEEKNEIAAISLEMAGGAANGAVNAAAGAIDGANSIIGGLDNALESLEELEKNINDYTDSSDE